MHGDLLGNHDCHKTVTYNPEHAGGSRIPTTTPSIAPGFLSDPTRVDQAISSALNRIGAILYDKDYTHSRRGSRGRYEPVRRRGGHFGRRGHFSLSDLREMGGRLQETDRRRPQLSIDRLRRWHQANQGENGYLRRLRHAAEARGPEGGESGPVSHDHRRRRSGGQHQGSRSGPAAIGWRHD